MSGWQGPKGREAAAAIEAWEVVAAANGATCRSGGG
jgi:hypothetical protein